MSFAERVLRFSFSGAASGSFSAAGLRAAVSIRASPDRAGSAATARIWGLTLEQMTQYSSKLASVPGGIQVQQFNLIIEAGDTRPVTSGIHLGGVTVPVNNPGGNLQQVINGPIFTSSIDLSGAPDSVFNIICMDTFTASNPIAPQSWPGTQNAEDLIASICAAASLTFDNSAGAHAVLRNQSVYGSAIDQIARIANNAELNWKKDGNTISIWPHDSAIDDVVIPLGPDTGLVGYPSFADVSLIVTSLFNPEIQIGRRINLTSSIPNANGVWQVVQVNHDLTTMMAKGPWFTTARLVGADA
jgi:hypothetical protein